MIDNKVITDIMENDEIYTGECFEYSSNGELMSLTHTWSGYNAIEQLMDDIVDLNISPKISTEKAISAAVHNLPLYITLEDIENCILGLYNLDIIANGQLSLDIDLPVATDPDLYKIKLTGGDISVDQAKKWTQLIDMEDPEEDLYNLNFYLLDNIPNLEMGFYDEYDHCVECYNIIRTTPDSYHWTPNFIRFEYGELLCPDCTNSDHVNDLIEEIQYKIDNGEQPQQLPHFIDLGYEWVEILHPKGWKWENGLHGGQIDDPLLQGSWIRSNFTDSGNQPLFQVLFNVFPSQFYVQWEILIRVDPNSDDIEDYMIAGNNQIYDTDLLEVIAESIGRSLYSEEVRLKHDPAELMKSALKQTTKAYSKIETNPYTGEISITETDNLDEYLNQ